LDRLPRKAANVIYQCVAGCKPKRLWFFYEEGVFSKLCTLLKKNNAELITLGLDALISLGNQSDEIDNQGQHLKDLLIKNSKDCSLEFCVENLLEHQNEEIRDNTSDVRDLLVSNPNNLFLIFSSLC